MTDSTAPDYSDIARQLEALLAGESDQTANAANASALIYSRVPDLNWLGFYFLRDGELVLGPFQGAPACVRIPLGRGVCGTAASTRQTLVVPNVHEFSGHIVCDSKSNSELVVPIVAGDRLAGVLDADSPSFDRFDEADREGFERLAQVFADSL